MSAMEFQPPDGGNAQREAVPRKPRRGRTDLAYEPPDHPEPHRDGVAPDGGSLSDPAAEAARIDYNKQVAKFNKILTTTRRQVTDDRVFGWIRGLAIVLLGGVMVGATVAVLITSQKASENPLPVIATSAVVVVALLFAGWVNPLQTIERDMVFRRWSDNIVATWVLEVTHFKAGPEQVEQAGHRAALRFAQLATSYSAAAAKATDALVSMAATAAAASAADTGADTSTMSVTSPGDQAATVGAPLKPTLLIVATGPGTLSFTVSAEHPLPDSLTISERTGEISGTPSKDGKFPVVVNVSTDKDGVGAVSCSFTYDISPAKPKGDAAKTDPATNTEGPAPTDAA